MRRLGELGIVVVGLAFILSAVSYVFGPLSALFGDIGDFSRLLAVMGYAVPVLLAGGAGIILVRRRHSLAERLFDEGESPLDIGPEQLLRVGLVLSGVYFVVDAMPSLAVQLFHPIVQTFSVGKLLGEPATNADVLDGLVRSIPYLIGILVRAGLGLLLVARSASLAQRFMGEPLAEEPLDLPECPACGEPYDPADYEGGIAPPRCANCKVHLDIPHA